MTTEAAARAVLADRDRFDHHNEERFRLRAEPGLREEVVRLISEQKSEPVWMLEKRLEGLKAFHRLPLPDWGPSLASLDLNQITFFALPDAKSNAQKWDEVPADIKATFEKLGIPQAEQRDLAGAGAQYESSTVYHNLKKEWESKGVIFLDMDVALQECAELVKPHFMTTCVPIGLHKFAALHAAVWSGGTFLYIPKGVHVDQPLQAYFRMNAKKMGQFEHTLIVVDEKAQGHYIEGCSAPQYGAHSLHAGCVEVHVKPGARFRYSSIENWSKNTFNLNTKRAMVAEKGIMEWVNGNMGCLTGDSLIYTNPHGPVPIKQIAPGTAVLALEEKSKRLVPANVKGMIYSGEKQVYKLRVAGRELKASANHPFLALRREKVPGNKRKGKFVTEWTALEQLKEGDLIAISKALPKWGEPYKLPSITISEKKVSSKNQYASFEMKTDHLYSSLTVPEYTTDDLMWFFGIHVGDGCLNKPERGSAKINIAIHEKTDLRKPLLETIASTFNYTVPCMKDRFIVINSNVLAELLVQCGFQGTAGTKRVPRWVFSLPESQRLAFLAGYLDSDGHVGKAGVYLTSISKGLLEDVKALAISCGMGVSRIFNHRKAHDTTILGKKVHARDSFRILLNCEKVKTIPTRSPSCAEDLKRVTTHRSFSGARNWNFGSKVSSDLGFARIDAITPLGIEPTYDIEVEGHHNFVAEGIVVHNSCVTMLYPCSVLAGKGARSDYLGIAFAGAGQNQDTGCKMYHLAPNTTSTIKAKSISKDGGITSYRGLVRIIKGATNAKCSVQCDALLVDEKSVSNTFPYMKITESSSDVAHEATVGRISQETLFYLMSRGLSEEQALQLVVSGFVEPIVKELPLEYAVELNRLIQLEMANAIG